MALYIQIKVGLDKVQTAEHVWHVGKENPVPFIDRKYVESVQADCDELEFITANFSGIPRRFGKRVVSWYGDDARFIAANL